MSFRAGMAVAATAAAILAIAPAARADFAMMAAHNYEILMRGVQRHAAPVPVRRVMSDLGRQGFSDLRLLDSPAGVYRIRARRNGRAFVVTAAAATGRILTVSPV